MENETHDYKYDSLVRETDDGQADGSEVVEQCLCAVGLEVGEPADRQRVGETQEEGEQETRSDGGPCSAGRDEVASERA